MLRAGIVSGVVCRSVCLCEQNVQNYWLEIDVTWQVYAPWRTLEVFGSWRDLTLKVIFLFFYFTCNSHTYLIQLYKF